MKRRISSEEGLEALRVYVRGGEVSKQTLATAVRFALEEFAERHPGHAVEIRVPWIGAVQAIEGVNHRRGTPPNVVEMAGQTWLDLVLGREVDEFAISHSGNRADLSPYMPLFGPAQLGI
ncbi:hypothetical protein J2S49_000747 [Arcanobacterium wilhelmae]|uniref:Bacterial SCP orthologue domain-containing protein n=1 Tax=Arcanobacterium wilhelmae TaxID=1803177 RepID=A0ABT9NB81_9ACTO|nr:sterol carrier family protein [Arcanobacterium wilhelmae]MDP9800671.1 hypothetical protein [Arcanobacterium wilhelmae]WFN90072.1 sterol carrier family protein [Arcanobacterium wilhelmae]